MKDPQEQKTTNEVLREPGPSLGWEQALAPEVGVTMTPTATRVVSVDTRKTGGELYRTEVMGVAKARRMIRTQEGETDPLRGPEGGTAPEATQGHQALKDLGDPLDQPDGKGTRDRSQESET